MSKEQASHRIIAQIAKATLWMQANSGRKMCCEEGAEQKQDLLLITLDLPSLINTVDAWGHD